MSRTQRNRDRQSHQISVVRKLWGCESFTFNLNFLIVLEFSVLAICFDSLIPSLTFGHFRNAFLFFNFF